MVSKIYKRKLAKRKLESLYKGKRAALREEKKAALRGKKKADKNPVNILTKNKQRLYIIVLNTNRSAVNIVMSTCKEKKTFAE